ncbi:MAG: nucleotidyltransferase domain-containing protein [Leptospiraceae bacterium]|nr:nucleotidyltransferase domain-containing protein [Leptospiraceae bacterium]MCP5513504.1 nucleotidyltransferase domain-containing protein [Leptospiraceae bacterium]
MKENDLELFQLFAKQLKQIIPEAVVWAFGSRTRGDANFLSDYDILVILPWIDPKQKKIISEIAWEISYENEIVISPIVYSKERFHYPAIQKSAFIQNIYQDGILI